MKEVSESQKLGSELSTINNRVRIVNERIANLEKLQEKLARRIQFYNQSGQETPLEINQQYMSSDDSLIRLRGELESQFVLFEEIQQKVAELDNKLKEVEDKTVNKEDTEIKLK